jgi:CubicO group peptidase (beta-lactamase class C family)
MRALLKVATSIAATCLWQTASTDEPAPAVPPNAATPAIAKPDVDAWLDGFMPYALKQVDIAGAVVVVVKDGAILTQKGYGYADVGARQPMDPERTLIRTGSVSKLFTWTAVMQLVEQGKLELDADVNTYLDFKIPARDGQPVTMRNLMTHTPGFEEQLKGVVTIDPAKMRTFEELLKQWTPERIFAPGEMAAYSNYGTSLAGYIVQRISRMPFNDYMNAHVLGPLGMTDSTFEQPLPQSLRPRMAKGYAVASMPERPFEILVPTPAGALTASATDMAKFMIAHLQHGRLADRTILQPQTAQRMHGTALTILPRVQRMLLGFYEANHKGRRVIAHAGDTQWFHSDLRLFPDDGVGMFVALNSIGKDGAAGDLRTALFEQFADRYLPVPGWTAGPGVEAGIARDHARLIAGRYSGSRRMDSSFMSLLELAGAVEVIDYRDGTIGVSMVRSPTGVPFRWREVEPFVWQLDGSARLLSAEVRDGRVWRFAFEEYSPFMMFERPSAMRAPWLLPVFVAALIALLMTALAWPASAWARRYYRVPQAVMTPDGRLHRWLRIAATATVAMWIAWTVTVATMMSDLSNLQSSLDGWLWFLHGISAIVVLSGAVVGVWYAVNALRSERRWYAKTWSVLLALAMLVSLWVAIAYNVITSGVNY